MSSEKPLLVNKETYPKIAEFLSNQARNLKTVLAFNTKGITCLTNTQVGEINNVYRFISILKTNLGQYVNQHGLEPGFAISDRILFSGIPKDIDDILVIEDGVFEEIKQADGELTE